MSSRIRDPDAMNVPAAAARRKHRLTLVLGALAILALLLALSLRMMLRPMAGETIRLPLRFSEPVPRLTWRPTRRMGTAPLWEVKSPQEGVLVWPDLPPR